MRKAFTFTLIGALLFGCSNEEGTTKKETSSEPTSKVEDKEISKEEKNEYVNQMLDVNVIWISVLQDIETFTQNNSPYEVKRSPVVMDELKTILSRIDNEMVPAFKELGLPPSEDLEPLYQVESDYVNEAQEIAKQMPLAVTGDPETKNQFKERLAHMKEMSTEISNIISSLNIN